MRLASNSSQSRRKMLYWLSGLVAAVFVTFVALDLARPTVMVGREWPLAERVACDAVSHQPWDDLLRRFVDANGNVDYTAWKNSADDLRQLDEYLDSLSRLDQQRSGSQSQRLAFWINGYNAVTVRGILREYPTTSIQNHVAHVWGYNIWRDLRLIVGDTSFSLGEIEHAVLRPLAEPRIHFAIVCASRGCPRLLDEAYTAERLEEQLQRNTLVFFADPTKCFADSTRHELRLSPILSWYAADFGSSTPDVLKRIADWLPADTKSLARSNNVRVVYLDYDWTLNDQSTATPPLPPPE